MFDLGLSTHSPLMTQKRQAGMPRTDDVVVFDVSCGERGAHVWAGIVDRVVFAILQKHSDDFSVDGKGLAFAFSRIAPTLATVFVPMGSSIKSRSPNRSDNECRLVV